MSKHTPPLVLVCFLGCTDQGTMPDVDPSFAKAGEGGSGTPSLVTVSGDLGPLPTADGGPLTASLRSRDPFQNLTLSGVQLTIPGSPLQGEPTTCDALALLPERTVVPNDSLNTWDARVQGDWLGELSVWGSARKGDGNLKFSGTRTDGLGGTIQFTANDVDDNAIYATNDSTTSLTFAYARLAFGAGGENIVPEDNGLPILYCLNTTITATRQ
jgi:hypothetical protein